MGKVFTPSFQDYFSLPDQETLINPLMDVPDRFAEENEMAEFYKLSNPHYSPMFGVKYLMNRNIYPFQASTLIALLQHKFPMLLFSRGGGKTFMLAIAAVYCAVMYPNSRVVLISGTFRQAKLIFQEIQKIYADAPLLQALTQKKPVEQQDRCVFTVHGSTIVGLPLGGGGKIRGERGHFIFVDEFDSINKEVFDVVIRGFGATQADPWENTRSILQFMKKKKSATEKTKGEIDSATMIAEAAQIEGNKIVISGTAGFNHGPFCKLYKQYMKIISHRVKGELKDYGELFEGDDEMDENIKVDHNQYCVISYKYTELPPGMMDVQMIHNARATMSKMYFDMEYMCRFADESSGFFKWKHIKETTQDPGGWCVQMIGSPTKQYVMGIDPARSRDRFAIVLIELGPPHRVRHVWSLHHERYDKSFEYCRHLIRVFNVIAVGLDLGGGGLTIKDMFDDPKHMEAGDRPIVVHDADEQKIRVPPGAHKMLYPFAWASTWIEEANVLLQKHIEEKTLEFPVENYIHNKQGFGSDAKVMDEITDEVNLMKREIVAIEVTYTTTGVKRFNLKPPDIASEPGEVVTHKDRYSALLMANYLAGKLARLEVYDPKAAAMKVYNDGDYDIGGWLESFMT